MSIRKGQKEKKHFYKVSMDRFIAFYIFYKSYISRYNFYKNKHYMYHTHEKF